MVTAIERPCYSSGPPRSSITDRDSAIRVCPNDTLKYEAKTVTEAAIRLLWCASRHSRVLVRGVRTES